MGWLLDTTTRLRLVRQYDRTGAWLNQTWIKEGKVPEGEIPILTSSPG
ncbi:DUF3598 family protein [Spirulina major CS-329]|nr:MULTISPECIES: DUF3598 family protein [Spirulina]MDB9493218.1 DUF3598 family protein [Spirulina subsalsa CS-330]MDB9505059.1 DUF3598 family protein [Spirulina major CS-329]